MHELTPFAYGSQPVRTILIDSELWFVVSDVATILGYRDAANAIRLLRAGQQRYSDLSTNAGSRRGYVTNESGLYRLILRSNRPDAVPFQEWVEDEVLPAIRKTGRYEVSVPQTFAQALELAAAQARELEAARPAVEFVDKFVSGAGTYLLREVAAVLNVKGMGQNNLFAFLRDHGVLIADGESRNLPYRRHIEAERFEVKVGERDNSRTGEPVAVRTVRVTPRGLAYIRSLLERNGYICMAVSA